jgi:formylglycine-generating enzyme required for sulfatase activity
MPVPEGEFLMGSPEAEPGRNPDEGPQHKVRISPFWMGRCEVTWNEYELFVFLGRERTLSLIQTDPAGDKAVDAICRPSAPYRDMTFGMGRDRYPAICMTQHAANKYCEWLAARTGQFYRLPSEAEWEYACRAGASTAYSFGNDPEKLTDYAWFIANSGGRYQRVGRKKPNAWGLCDMHGNVAEWCLDQYEGSYQKFAGAIPQDPWNKAVRNYPHSVRGGSYDDEPALLRSAARFKSDKSWKLQDPEFPKSVWYHTDANFVGFRIVRPFKLPSEKEMFHYWNSGVEKE